LPVIKNELWKAVSGPAIYAVTTSASITKDGRLVMGRGAALQAVQRIPGIAYEAAQAIITSREQAGHLPHIPYGFLIVRPPRPEEGKYGFGIFQVKDHWERAADLNIISCSMACLRYYAHSNPDITIRMNYPGIGYGKLFISSVAPLLTDLPKNVYIFYGHG